MVEARLPAVQKPVVRLMRGGRELPGGMDEEAGLPDADQSSGYHAGRELEIRTMNHIASNGFDLPMTKEYTALSLKPPMPTPKQADSCSKFLRSKFPAAIFSC